MSLSFGTDWIRLICDIRDSILAVKGEIQRPQSRKEPLSIVCNIDRTSFHVMLFFLLQTSFCIYLYGEIWVIRNFAADIPHYWIPHALFMSCVRVRARRITQHTSTCTHANMSPHSASCVWFWLRYPNARRLCTCHTWLTRAQTDAYFPTLQDYESRWGRNTDPHFSSCLAQTTLVKSDACCDPYHDRPSINDRESQEQTNDLYLPHVMPMRAPMPVALDQLPDSEEIQVDPPAGNRMPSYPIVR